MKNQVNEYTKSREEAVCKRFNISSGLLEIWIKKFNQDLTVTKIIKDISDLHHQVMIE